MSKNMYSFSYPSAPITSVHFSDVIMWGSNAPFSPNAPCCQPEVVIWASNRQLFFFSVFFSFFHGEIKFSVLPFREWLLSPSFFIIITNLILIIIIHHVQDEDSNYM